MNYTGVRWVRWLCSVDVSNEHIAILLDIDPVEVDRHLAYHRRAKTPMRIPAWWQEKGSLTHRQIRNDSANIIRRLHELGYEVERVASIMMLQPEAVADFLKRATSADGAQLVKPRTKPEQRRVDNVQRRRELRRAAAAKVTADWMARLASSSQRDDDGCPPPPPAIAPPAAELVDHRVEAAVPAPAAKPVDHRIDAAEPPPPVPWEGPIDPKHARDPLPVRSPRIELKKREPSPVVRPPDPNQWDDRSDPRSIVCGKAAKLSIALAREIRRDRADGMSWKALADRHRVCQDTVRKVVKRQIWIDSSLPCPDAGVPENGQ